MRKFTIAPYCKFLWNQIVIEIRRSEGVVDVIRFALSNLNFRSVLFKVLMYMLVHLCWVEDTCLSVQVQFGANCILNYIIVSV